MIKTTAEAPSAVYERLMLQIQTISGTYTEDKAKSAVKQIYEVAAKALHQLPLMPLELIEDGEETDLSESLPAPDGMTVVESPRNSFECVRHYSYGTLKTFQLTANYFKKGHLYGLVLGDETSIVPVEWNTEKITVRNGLQSAYFGEHMPYSAVITEKTLASSKSGNFKMRWESSMFTDMPHLILDKRREYSIALRYDFYQIIEITQFDPLMITDPIYDSRLGEAEKIVVFYV